MKPMDLGYILEVRLAGFVERLDGRVKVRTEDKRKTHNNCAQVLSLAIRGLWVSFANIRSLSEEQLS